MKKSRRHTKPSCYAVTNEYLLYKISDTGILHIYLRGVSRDKANPERKVYFFDRVPEIREIIDRFKEEYGDKEI